MFIKFFIIIIMIISTANAEFKFTKVLDFEHQHILLDIKSYNDQLKLVKNIDPNIFQIYSSIDNGENWELEHETEDMVEGFSNITYQTSYFDGDNFILGFSDGYIITKFSNSQYKQIKLPTLGPIINLCIDNEILYVGDFFNLYSSQNYGMTWDTLFAGTNRVSFASNSLLINNNSGIILAGKSSEDQQGLIFKSTNFGQTWNSTKLNESYNLFSGLTELAIHNNVIFAGARDQYGVGHLSAYIVYKSYDFGKTWINSHYETKEATFGIQSLQFYDEMKGIMSAFEIKLFVTYDGAYTWEQVHFPNDKEITSGRIRCAWTGDGNPIISISGFGVYKMQLSTNVQGEIEVQTIKVKRNEIEFSEEIDTYHIFELETGKVIKNEVIRTNRILINDLKIGRYAIMVHIGNKMKIEKFIKE